MVCRKTSFLPWIEQLTSMADEQLFSFQVVHKGYCEAQISHKGLEL